MADDFRISTGRPTGSYDAASIWADPVVEVNGRQLDPGEPFVVRTAYRRRLLCRVVEYRRDEGVAIVRTEHRRWWWVTPALALWWLRRTTDVPTKKRPPQPAQWVREYEHGAEFLETRNGVDWLDAPLPPRRHECTPQMRGFMSGGRVERCACGAVRVLGSGPWMERNSRRG